jgi:hypothetical protein
LKAADGSIALGQLWPRSTLLDHELRKGSAASDPTGRDPRFERDDVLPACEHNSAKRHHVHLANGVTDDSKGILSDLTVGHDVVRRIDIAARSCLAMMARCHNFIQTFCEP